MDTWYATKDMMMRIDSLNKIFYCPLKSNRSVYDSSGTKPYQQVSQLHWNDEEEQHGKLIKVKGFPKNYKVQLFRVVVSTNRMDRVVTNDTTQDDVNDTQEVCAIRWKIEQLRSPCLK